MTVSSNPNPSGYLADDPSFPALLIVGALFIGGFFGYLNDTLLNVALPTFMAAFHLNETQAQWLTSGFLLVMGAFTPITASLIQWFTTRTMALLTFGNFALGTLICLLAPNFGVLLLGRFFQALSAAITVPLLMNTIFALYPPERRGTYMGLVTMAFTVAPAIGPTLSGFIIQYAHWRGLFLLPLLFILLVLALIYRHLHVNVMTITKPKIDLPLALLSIFGFGSLVLAVSQFQMLGPAKTLGLLLLAGLLITAFIRRQLRLETPLLNLRTLAVAQYRYSVIMLGLAFFLFMGLELLLPLYGRKIRLLAPVVMGLVLLPASLGEALLAPVLGRLLDRHGGKLILRGGAYLLLFNGVLLLLLTKMTTAPVLIALAFAGFAVGVSCVITGETHGLNALPPAQTPHGTAIITTVNPLAGALGAAFFTGLMHLGERWSSAPDEAARMLDGVHLALSLTVGFTLLIFYVSRHIERVEIKGRAH